MASMGSTGPRGRGYPWWAGQQIVGLGVISEPGDCVQVKPHTLVNVAQNPAVRGTGGGTVHVPSSPTVAIRISENAMSSHGRFYLQKIMNLLPRLKIAVHMTGW